MSIKIYGPRVQWRGYAINCCRFGHHISSSRSSNYGPTFSPFNFLSQTNRRVACFKPLPVFFPGFLVTLSSDLPYFLTSSSPSIIISIKLGKTYIFNQVDKLYARRFECNLFNKGVIFMKTSLGAHIKNPR